MGLQGVCLATTQWLPINNNYTFKFNLDGKLVSNKGTVRWVKLVGNKKGENQDSVPVYLTGIEFKSVLTDKGRDLARVLDEYSTQGEKRLSGKRFKINAPGKTVFNILHEYPIRQISSGGMLVETDLELHLEKTFPWVFSYPGDDRPIQCKGKVVSRLETFTENKRRYSIGVAFTDLQHEERKHLARFIMKAMFQGLKTSLMN
jgi:hypothetical protein